jgi:hypothetical protein
MKLLKPSPYDPSMVIYNDAPEPTSAWASGTSYAKDAKVLYPVAYPGYTVNHIFISLVSSNTSTPGTDATKWQDLGVCNKCAAFDRQVSSQTTSTTSLTIRIEPNPNWVDAIALMNITGTSAQVIVTDGGASPPIYNQTFDLETSVVDDWYEYFFEPFVFEDQLVVTGLPLRLNAQITVTITGTGTVAIGEFIFGTLYTLGDYGTEQGATIGIIDYSRKDTDPDTGVVTFTERAFSKRMSATFLLDNTGLRTVQRLLADVRAVPSVYIGSESADYQPLVVYGFYRDFSIDIAYPTRSLCRLEIEGLI